jgi:hypothetical protein
MIIGFLFLKIERLKITESQAACLQIDTLQIYQIFSEKSVPKWIVIAESVLGLILIQTCTQTT